MDDFELDVAELPVEYDTEPITPRGVDGIDRKILTISEQRERFAIMILKKHTFRPIIPFYSKKDGPSGIRTPYLGYFNGSSEAFRAYLRETCAYEGISVKDLANRMD